MRAFIASLFLIGSSVAAAIGLLGCGGNPGGGNTTPGGGHGHHHDAPHGGTLIVLGGEAHTGHLEFKLDRETGELSLWVLDGEARGSVRLKDHSIAIECREIKGGEHAGESVQLQLSAQASDSTGEKPGDSSEFRGQNDHLKGAEGFAIHIPSLKVKGIEQGPLTVPYPEGNEGGHDEHDHGDHDHDDHDHGHDHDH